MCARSPGRLRLMFADGLRLACILRKYISGAVDGERNTPTDGPNQQLKKNTKGEGLNQTPCFCSVPWIKVSLVRAINTLSSRFNKRLSREQHSPAGCQVTPEGKNPFGNPLPRLASNPTHPSPPTQPSRPSHSPRTPSMVATCNYSVG